MGNYLRLHELYEPGVQPRLLLFPVPINTNSLVLPAKPLKWDVADGAVLQAQILPVPFEEYGDNVGLMLTVPRVLVRQMLAIYRFNEIKVCSETIEVPELILKHMIVGLFTSDDIALANLQRQICQRREHRDGSQ